MAVGAYDYVPVGVVTGLDLFFMPRALAQQHSVPAVDLSNARLELHFHKPMSAANAAELVDYEAYLAAKATPLGGMGLYAQHAAQLSALHLLANFSHHRHEHVPFTCARSPQYCNICKHARLEHSML